MNNLYYQSQNEHCIDSQIHETIEYAVVVVLSLLPPDEQEIVKIAPPKAGVSQPMDFDQYVENINWIP